MPTLKEYTESIYEYLFEDMTNRKISIFILIGYIIIGYKFVPELFIIFINNPIGRLITLLTVIYLFTKDTVIGLLSLVAFWITLTDGMLIMNSDGRDKYEHFESCQGPDCPHSDVNLKVSVDKEGNEINPDSDENNENDEDDDDDMEAFYVPEESNIEQISDNFKVIHDTIHKLEKMLKKSK